MTPRDHQSDVVASHASFDGVGSSSDGAQQHRLCEDVESSGPTPLRRLSQRLARRTTDLLAIAIISIGLLSVSGRLLDWWSTDAASTEAALKQAVAIAGQPLHLGAGDSVLRIRAGDLPVEVERQLVLGDLGHVEALLKSRCATVLSLNTNTGTGTNGISAATAPDEDRTKDALEVSRELATAQTHLQTLLLSQVPVVRQPGWSIYRLTQAETLVPGCMVIGVRCPPGSAPPGIIHCWGLAVPEGPPDTWTTWFFSPQAHDRPSSSGTTPASPLPALQGSQIVLSLQTPAGEELAVLHRLPQSAVTASQWMSEIDEKLARISWKQTRPWSRVEQTWSARFELMSIVPETGSRQSIEYSLRETDSTLSLTAVILRNSRSDE